MIELMMIKLMAIVIALCAGMILLKILNQYLLLRMAKEKAMAVYNKKETEKYKMQQELERQEMERIINFKEVEPYYEKTKDLFKYLIKSAKLNRQQVLYLKKLISNSTHSIANNNKKYTNEAHFIYDNLKNGNMSIGDYEKCFDYLSNFV